MNRARFRGVVPRRCKVCRGILCVPCVDGLLPLRCSSCAVEILDDRNKVFSGPFTGRVAVGSRPRPSVVVTRVLTGHFWSAGSELCLRL